MTDPATNRVAPKVLAAAASGVVAQIAEHNGDVDTIFGRAAIQLDDLDSPFNELNLSQYCALFEEAAAQTGCDNFGLRFGHGFLPQQLGAIGYIALSAPTLAAALRYFVNYFPAHQDSSLLSLQQDRDLLWLRYQILDPRITRRRQDAELSIGIFVNLLRRALGERWAPLEIQFEHDRPDGANEFVERFQTPVSFGCSGNAIAFRRSDLDTPMPDCDPYLFAVVEPFLAERRARAIAPPAFVEELRRHVKLRLGQRRPTLHGLAAELGTGAATLRRQLKHHGISFNGVLDAARQEVALHHVGATDMALTEIAMTLGYSELSAFSRAFRRWTGMPPQRYRIITAERRQA